MSDRFASQTVSLESPLVSGRVLLPGDGEFEPTRAVWINATGLLSLTLADDSAPVVLRVDDGMTGLNRLRVKRVISFTLAGTVDRFTEVAEIPAIVGFW